MMFTAIVIIPRPLAISPPPPFRGDVAFADRLANDSPRSLRRRLDNQPQRFPFVLIEPVEILWAEVIDHYVVHSRAVHAPIFLRHHLGRDARTGRPKARARGGDLDVLSRLELTRLSPV